MKITTNQISELIHQDKAGRVTRENMQKFLANPDSVFGPDKPMVLGEIVLKDETYMVLSVLKEGEERIDPYMMEWRLKFWWGDTNWYTRDLLINSKAPEESRFSEKIFVFYQDHRPGLCLVEDPVSVKNGEWKRNFCHNSDVIDDRFVFLRLKSFLG